MYIRRYIAFVQSIIIRSEKYICTKKEKEKGGQPRTLILYIGEDQNTVVSKKGNKRLHA